VLVFALLVGIATSAFLGRRWTGLRLREGPAQA
jgi:hypothetical protein